MQFCSYSPRTLQRLNIDMNQDNKILDEIGIIDGQIGMINVFYHFRPCTREKRCTFAPENNIYGHEFL